MVVFYLVGHRPTAMTTAGRFMDGLLVGAPFLSLLNPGRWNCSFRERTQPLPMLNVPVCSGTSPKSTSRSSKTARRPNHYPKPFIAHMMSRPLREMLPDVEFKRLGVDQR